MIIHSTGTCLTNLPCRIEAERRAIEEEEIRLMEAEEARKAELAEKRRVEKLVRSHVSDIPASCDRPCSPTHQFQAL